MDGCSSADDRLSRDIESLTVAALETPDRAPRRSRFSRQVEVVRQHLRLLTDRDLLAASYARESSVILREHGSVETALALEADPVVVAYALRWLEMSDTTTDTSQARSVRARPFA